MDNKILGKELPLTLGEIFDIAKEKEVSPIDIVLEEAKVLTGKSEKEILEEVLKEFKHNLDAVDKGLTDGESLLFGVAGRELNELSDDNGLFKDKFINDALKYSIAAQVGNHVIGLNPCAGTGDPCVYTGYLKAMYENGYDESIIARIAAMILKVGSLFRMGKISTGCNMEGFGAGAAAIAAASVEIQNGTVEEMERAMVLAISPTIAVPCTPRVMVPALCATHLGGAILVGHMAAGMAMKTTIEVNVPIDVMLAMASEIHPISAEKVTPVVVKYMRPFFKTKDNVEELIDKGIKEDEKREIEETLKKAKEVSKDLAKKSRPITNTLGEAVVGGSSQAVGSPTNTGRIAHELFKLEDDVKNIRKIKIGLYPELFARRGINVPGIIMGAIFGSSTSDGETYQKSIEMAKDNNIDIEIEEIEEFQAQQVTLESGKYKVKVEALNRGGGRLVIQDAIPSKEKAKKVAKELGIVLAEE